MIDRETLHEAILKMGHTEAIADAFCDWYFDPAGYQYSIDQMEAVLETARQAIAAAATSFSEMLDEMTDLVYIQLPDKQWPRPPRYAGPQNKGRSWNRQPPRLARSNCRKMRR